MSESEKIVVRILVVDDEPDLEPLFVQRFRKAIRKGEMELFFASNGIEALEELERNGPLDLVITDINMPEMDGLSLLAEMKNVDPLLKGIVISAYGDMQNIRNAMNRGAFDFVTKPIDFDDLAITIEKTYREASTLRQAMAAHEMLMAMEHELDVARRIQQTIIAQHTEDFTEVEGVSVASAMITARAVGGDFYLCFRPDDHCLAFGVGDVAGKGVPAALFMSMTCTMMYTVTVPGLDLEENMARVNQALCKGNEAGLFVTVFFARLDLETGEVVYCNAGHNPPCLIDASGRVRFLEQTGGMVLGVIEEACYEVKRFILAPGETLYLYTDGITEAMNGQKELYGEERLKDVLAQLAAGSTEEIMHGVLEDVRRFTKGVEQHDDMTALALRFEPE